MKSIERLRELSETGVAPPFWLRDDDLCEITPQFRNFIRRVSKKLPLLIAAVPHRLRVSVADQEWLSSLYPRLLFCVHGYAHTNHATGRPDEFPQTRSEQAVANELKRGISIVEGYFGARFVPVFVPPWNGFAPCHAKTIEAAGFSHISGIETVKVDITETSLKPLHVAVDILDYPPAAPYPLKSPARLDAELGQTIDAWIKRAQPDAPIALLSHHTSMSPADLEAYLDFIEQLDPYVRGYDNLLGLGKRSPSGHISKAS